MIIYRVETEAGLGPYSGMYGVAMNCGGVHHMPAPWEDEGLCKGWSEIADQERYYFGFSSVAQLLEWFASDSFHRVAEAKGYLVSEVEARGNYLHGKYQSIFDRSQSEVRRRFTFADAKQIASNLTH